MYEFLEEFLRPQVAAVLEDCVNQLAVLGGVAPAAIKDGGESTKLLVGDSIGQAVEKQRELEIEYDRLLREREDLQMQGGSTRKPLGARVGYEDGGFLSFRSSNDIEHPSARLDENEARIADVARRLKRSTQDLVTNLRQNPSAAENMVKMQGERQHIQDLIADVLSELDEEGGFGTLVVAMADALADRASLKETIDKEQNSREMVQQLAQRCGEIEQEKESQIIQLDETIAQLKDQLQQTKARVGDEGKYIKKEANVNVAVAFKKSNQEVEENTNKIKEMQRLAAEEATCHNEVCEFLKKNYVELSKKLGEWTDKQEADTTAKDEELSQLKSDRARDLDLLTKLTDKYNAYEKVCLEDRKRREKQKRQAEQAVRNLAAAVKIQSWWRAMLVRNKLGPFKAKSKKGGKKKGKKKK